MNNVMCNNATCYKKKQTKKPGYTCKASLSLVTLKNIQHKTGFLQV